MVVMVTTLLLSNLSRRCEGGMGGESGKPTAGFQSTACTSEHVRSFHILSIPNKNMIKYEKLVDLHVKVPLVPPASLTNN